MDQIIDNALPATKFQIFTGILKASKSVDGRMRLHGVASSTTKDMHGDRIEASAIEDMLSAANKNLTIFLNHSYNVPEDVAGSVEAARMNTRGVTDTGDPNHDLDMDILINDANPRAVQAFEAIERGTKLGLSIGAMIPEGGARKDKGAFIIDHIQLMETSLVGIPANPRSWVEYAVKSLKAAEPIVTEPVLDVTDLSPNPLVVTEAMCPSCGKSQQNAGDCGNAYHKSITPDVADALVTIQIDTDPDAQVEPAVVADAPDPQDGPPTTPETGDGDLAASAADAVIAKLDTGFDTNVVKNIVDLLRSTTSELVSAKGQVTELTTSLAAVTTERDSAVAQRDKVLTETKRVLNNLANTPLMRRAVVVEAEKELRTKFEGLYSEDFLQMLEKSK